MNTPKENVELLGLLSSVMRKAAQGDSVDWSYWIKATESAYFEAITATN